jgi:hypothetical protein
MSGDPRNVCLHREWTIRKIDTNDDGDQVRADVANFQEGPDLEADERQWLKDLRDQLVSNDGEVPRLPQTVDLIVNTPGRLEALDDKVQRAIDEAHAASVLAGNVNRQLDAIVKHLGIVLPPDK